MIPVLYKLAGSAELCGETIAREQEDSGLVAAQTLSSAKTSQAASEAPDRCQYFGVFGGFKESARALARA